MEKISYLRFHVQRVLPLVYDDSLSYYELLNKVVLKLNDAIDITNENLSTIRDVVNEWLEENEPETILGLDALKTYKTPLDYKVAITDDDDAMISNMITSIERDNLQAVIPAGNYTLNKGFATDEKYLISNQGSFTNNGVSISRQLNFETYYKRLFTILYSDIDLGEDYQVQGSCYNRDRNTIYIVFYNTADPTATQIWEFNRNMQPINHAFVGVYHGAGMIYDERSQQLVVVGGNDDPNHFIYFINPATLVITERKNINPAGALHGISRDAYGNWFVVDGHRLLNIYDSNWNFIKGINDPFLAIINGIGETAGLDGTTLFQTITPSYDGQVFVLYNIQSKTDRRYMANVIAQVNFADNQLKGFHSFIPTDPLYEGESAFFIGHKMYVIECNFSTKRFTLIECAEMTSGSLLDMRNFSAFGGIIGIPSGSDLNDYKDPGLYYTNDGATTSSLLNLPAFTGGFTGISLRVELEGNVNIKQIMYSQPATMYRIPWFYRIFDTVTGSWRDWAAVPVTRPMLPTLINNAHKMFLPGDSQEFTIDASGWVGNTGNFYLMLPCIYDGTPTISNVTLVIIAKDSTGEVNITDNGYEALVIHQAGNIPYIRILLQHIANTAFRNCLAKVTIVCTITFS